MKNSMTTHEAFADISLLEGLELRSKLKGTKK